jgi:GNAT superfamily N-acetyltransferase
MDDIQVEPFDRATHQRGAFCCGEPSLDDFLHMLVTQYDKRRLGKTFVAVRPGETTVLGYYTLASSALAFAHLPTAAAKRLPKHPLPVVLLGRLAVDQSLQGIGLGEALLMDALQRSLDLSRSLGVFAVEVVAIDDRAAAFYAKYGFMPLLDNPRHMYLPIDTIEGVVAKKPG